MVKASLIALICLSAAACAEEESLCETGGPCETTVLLQCTCCAPAEVDNCKADKAAACATGKLYIAMTETSCVEQNKMWQQYLEAEKDPCLERPADTIEQVCTPLMTHSPGGTEGGSEGDTEGSTEGDTAGGGGAAAAGASDG